VAPCRMVNGAFGGGFRRNCTYWGRDLYKTDREKSGNWGYFGQNVQLSGLIVQFRGVGGVHQLFRFELR
jgi:hypothetical protein